MERSHAEETKRNWCIASWVVYLIGLPPWVWIFCLERNWIAASLEAGGAPAMVLGLVIALRGRQDEPTWLQWFKYIVIGIAVLAGFGYSWQMFRGITTLNQVLELGIVVGFLVGTILLANKKPSGYLWFLLMNGSNAWLMAVEHYPWLVVQQVVSFLFIADAFLIQRRRTQSVCI
jgi:hypothetical protein